MYDAENPKPALCDNLGGRMVREAGEGGSRGRRCVYLMPIHVDVWQKKKKITILLSNYPLI